MALLGKKPAAPAPFVVPPLADASTAYAALLAKQAELHEKRRTLVAEALAREKAIAATPTPRPAYSSRVAALLDEDEADDSDNSSRLRLRANVGEIADVDAALSVLAGRLREAKGLASQAVCAAVKPEYARRVAVMADAMTVLDEAHKAYDELRFALEAEDVAWMALTPMTPAFLGQSNEPDCRIVRWLREAREAGYYA
jgi:hypothetical protein